MAATKAERRRRVEKADALIRKYYSGADKSARRDALVDILTDLRHWALAENLGPMGWNNADTVARKHFNAEIG